MRVQEQNRDKWNEGRSLSDADFYTVGYSGRSQEALLDRLEEAQVASLVDIRANPVSMYRPEFSKGNLQRALTTRGISYWHERDLGVPRDVRALAIGREDRGAIWDWYDANVVERYVAHNLYWFFNAVEHPVALMCTELDPTDCHRHRLFQALETSGFQGFDL